MNIKAGFDENQLRDPHTGEWIDTGMALDEVADAVATAAIAWGKLRGGSPPPHDEVRDNWARQLEGSISDDEEAHRVVGTAQRENSKNPLWRTLMGRFVPDVVVVVRDPAAEDRLAAAHRKGGATFINDRSVRSNADLPRQRRADLDHTPAVSTELGGLPALLRHEYGHSIDDVLDADTERRIHEALPDPRRDLTLYGGKEGELIPELFAVITDPNYDPEDWPPSVQRAGEILMGFLLAEREKSQGGPMKHKTYELLETKADDENGVGWFTALASVFGNVDHVGDRVMPGAFKKTLGKWRQSGSPIPVFLSHQWDNPFSLIGEVDPRAVVENEKGLLVQGKLDMENDTARQVHKLMKRGLLKGFSFGYNVPEGGEKLNTEDGANELYEVDLVELGPTLKGANPEARVEEVKATLPPVTSNDLRWATESTGTDATVTLTKTPDTLEHKASRNVGPGARAHLRSLIEYYMKKPHPFTACVRDNTKRFGPEGAKRVCATLKDIGMGTTHWREGHHSDEPEAKSDERDWEQELYDAAEGNLEGLLEMHHEHMERNDDLKSLTPGSAEADEPETVKPAAKADPLKDEIDRLRLEIAVGKCL